MDAGHEPGITHDLGTVSSIRLRLSNIYYIVKDQQLSQLAIQDQVALDSEAVHNTMSQAMATFSNKLFKKYHKSSYSEEDIAVLDEYRTLANVGIVKQPNKTKPQRWTFPRLRLLPSPVL